MMAADWLARMAIFAGIYSGASLAWKVCGPKMLPMQNAALIKAVAKTLCGAQYVSYRYLECNGKRTVWYGQRH
jgi:hypothetical protein